ncbi:MAG: carbohydrate binding family 9 domain-containing protein [Candidatus Aminicenantes bacterium]|nr:carbohydrate binding family 9 domain-containing protein [Candidatus Aminicenantes bacterium]
MAKYMIYFLVFPVLLPLPATAAEVKAVRVGQGPRIDGKLDDPAWQAAVVFTGFRMTEPRPGGEPSERTELWIVYDEASLYIGIRCLDGEPERITALSMAHDNGGGDNHGWGGGGSIGTGDDDVVRVLLDPFQDKRTAYFFAVNPRGARSEGLVSGGSSSLNWDGIWDASGHSDGAGWSAEMRIPFKTISFKPGLASWGINVERYIARRQEKIRLSGTERDSNFVNPMDAAALSGIAGVRHGLGVTFRPYGLASVRDSRVAGNGADWQLDGGFDVYKNFTPNLVGAFSYNMDFAETEADERRINLTRFPLYFPEKRMFFLEGSETFSFSSSVSFQPFFSRKIGLFEGQPVPILFGGKVYGKVGRTNIAALDVQTETAGGLPACNFLALRLTQDVLSESKLGLIVTNGSPSGERNTLAGADFRFATSRFAGSKNLNLAAWAAYNWNEHEEGSHVGFGFRANYPNDLWDVQSTYAYYGAALDPGLGFMMRRGIQTAYLRVGFQPRPARGWLQRAVRQFFFNASGDFYWDLEGNLETRQLEVALLSFKTENGADFEFEIASHHDVLPQEFEVAAGVVLPAGPYDFTGCRCDFSTAAHRALTLDAGIDFGQFYSGRYEDVNVGLTFKYKGYANLGLDVNWVRGRLPQGDFSENVYQLKADVFLSPDLGFMNYVQYDTVSRLLGWSARLKWRLSPGNELALVYNKSWERRWNPTARFFPSEERGVLKLSLSFRP